MRSSSASWLPFHSSVEAASSLIGIGFGNGGNWGRAYAGAQRALGWRSPSSRRMDDPSRSFSSTPLAAPAPALRRFQIGEHAVDPREAAARPLGLVAEADAQVAPDAEVRARRDQHGLL